MTGAELKHKLMWNSISGYYRTLLRLVLGLVMFRLIWQNFSQEEVGYWGLLWSLLFYGILMDFGMGMAAQKRVAELSARKEWESLSRILSTILYLYILIAAVVILPLILSSDWLIGLVQSVSKENREPFRQMLVMFLVFMWLSFPLGIFIEILYGQQRVVLANNLNVAFSLINFGLLFAAIHFGWGLKIIFLFSLICALMPNLIGGILGLRTLPGVSLHPRHFSLRAVKETLHFSFFVYLSIISNVIRTQSHKPLLSVTLGLPVAAIYVAGTKVSEMFTSFTHQLPEVISPAAAHLHASDNRAGLRKLLIAGTRVNVMIATLLGLLCACYMEGLLRILTGDPVIPPEMILAGEVLVAWSYSSIITHSITGSVFMMSGHEKQLTRLRIIEAIANLSLSIALALIFRHVVAVAFGGLIPAMIIGWGFLWPWSAREAGISGIDLARRVLFRTWAACLPALAFILVMRFLPWFDFRQNLFLFFAQSGVAGALMLAGLWRWAVTDEERAQILGKLGRLVQRAKPA